MTSYVSGQKQPNVWLWLATGEGKINRCCPLGIDLFLPAMKFRRKKRPKGVECHTINPLLTKLVRSTWLGIIMGSLKFCVFMYLDFVSVQKNTKRELDQYISSYLDLALGQWWIFISICRLSWFGKECPGSFIGGFLKLAFSAFLPCCWTQHWKYFLFPLAR